MREPIMSALRGKADMPNEHAECPLMTPSGNLSMFAAFSPYSLVIVSSTEGALWCPRTCRPPMCRLDSRTCMCRRAQAHGAACTDG
jgi:hypothetical protein